VEVSGITITHATLHNFDEIKRLDVRIGDTVIVTRSGDVIPKITRVFPELRNGKEKIITLPRHCPIDGSLVVCDGVLLKCSNTMCGARNRNRIIHFVSRGAFNIQGLGKKIIDRFLDEGLIADAGDIFSLRAEDISVLERFGEKSADNIIEEIAKAKQITLSRFLYALGIPQVGEETARAFATRLIHDNRKKEFTIADVITVNKKYSIMDLQEFLI
jgi:DNA ligase (NAD+)